MNTPNHPPHPPVPVGVGFSSPGRVIEVVERVRMPSGRLRELLKVIETTLDQHGVLRTYEHLESTPPLDCSDSPEDFLDAVECSGCFSLVCSKHSGTCGENIVCGCGQVFCGACLATVSIEGKEGKLCMKCAWKMNNPVLSALVEWVWG